MFVGFSLVPQYFLQPRSLLLLDAFMISLIIITKIRYGVL